MNRNLRVLGAGAAIRAFGVSMLLPFFALYLRNVLSVGYVQIGSLFLLIGIPPLFVSAAGGLIADRFGRRRLILLSLALEAVSMLFVAYAIHLASFLLSVAGVATMSVVATLGGPGISAYVADLSQGSERTQGYTYLRIGWNGGFSAGVTAGGALAGLFGFVTMGLAAGAILAGGTVFIAALLEASPYDLLRSQGRRGLELGSPRAGPGSVRNSLRVLGTDRPFLVVCLAVALAGLVQTQWSVTFPLFAFRVLGIPYVLLGTGLALNGLVVVFGQTSTTRSVVGRRHTTIAILGVALYSVAFLLLGLSGQFNLFTLVVFYLVVLILTVGENLLAIPQMTLPSNMAPPPEIGAYNGAFFTISGVGPLLAILLGGVALASISSPLLLWTVLVLPAIPAIVLFRYVGRRLSPSINRA